MSTTTAYEEQDERAAWHGWGPSTAPACPRVAAGRRCQAWRDDEQCICQRHHHALDHGRCWLSEDGRHVVTGEPYDIGGAELAALLSECAALGLTVTLTGSSLWNPGSTMLLIIEDAKAPT